MSSVYEGVVARLREVAAFAPDKPDETPETTAQALWFAAASTPVAVTRVSDLLPPLTGPQGAALERLVDRRIAGEPLAYLIGRQEFLGLEFLTAPGALIPRRETEILGSAALELAHRLATEYGDIRVLDLGTGSGNLAVSLAVHEPRATLWASDLEAGAVAIAAKNVAMHGVTDRVRLLQGDLFGALAHASPTPSPFHLVVCNPPYIPTHKAQSMPVEVGGFEPTAAFDGGDFGLSVVLRLISEAPRHLVPGGWLAFELGVGQARVVEKRMTGLKMYAEIRTLSDKEGIARALVARCAS